MAASAATVHIMKFEEFINRKNININGHTSILLPNNRKYRANFDWISFYQKGSSFKIGDVFCSVIKRYAFYAFD